MFELSTTPIDPAALKAKLANPDAGGCVIFEGWVRRENEGRAVVGLTYEAYEALALKEGAAILDDACGRFDVFSAHCVHRTGRLAIGELAVWVGVAAGHRGDAFDACRWIIDEIKRRVPIWKNEHYAEGDSGWVNAPAADSTPVDRS